MALARLSIFLQRFRQPAKTSHTLSEEYLVEDFLFALSIKDEAALKKIKDAHGFKKALHTNLQRLEVRAHFEDEDFFLGKWEDLSEKMQEKVREKKQVASLWHKENFLYLMKSTAYSTQLIKAYAAILVSKEEKLLTLFNQALDSNNKEELSALQSFTLEVIIYLREKKCALDLKDFCKKEPVLKDVSIYNEPALLRFCYNWNILWKGLKTATFSGEFATDFNELRFDFLVRLKSAIKKLNLVHPALTAIMVIIKDVPKFYVNCDETRLPEWFDQVKERLQTPLLGWAKRNPDVDNLIARYADQGEKLAGFLAQQALSEQESTRTVVIP